MKRYLVLLVCLLVGTSTVAEARQMSFGGRIGLNSATFGGDDVDDFDVDIGSRTGIVAGVHLRVPLGGGISLQPELLYSQRGASFNEEFFGETVTATIKMDYIEVPVLVRFDIPLAQAAVRPAVFIGPSFAFEMSCKFAFSGFGESGSEDCDEDEDFERNKLDIGLAFGGGLDFPMSFGAIVVDGRYTLGLRTIDNDSQDPADIKHRVWSISAGISIPVGGR
jgi:hypothetical protein